MSERIATVYDLARLKKALCSNGRNCYYCPLGMRNNGQKIDCLKLLSEYPDKANEIILKWCDENPTKTFKDDFLEKFPNCITENGVPMSCRNTIYGLRYREYKCTYECVKCWNKEMPE